MKLRQNLIGMLLILAGCGAVYASGDKSTARKSAKADSLKAKPAVTRAHSVKTANNNTSGKQSKVSALQKLALLQDRLPNIQPVSNEPNTALTETEATPEIKGSVKVTVTRETPATGVVTHTPGMTEEEKAKPENRPEQPIRQIITGEESNELYILAEDQPIPEKLIANPDAQYAVVGGNEEKVARKVNAYKWAAKKVASKVAKIKQIAALKAAEENKQLEAWRDRNLTIVFDNNDPTNIDVRMLPAGASIRFYLDKLSRQHQVSIPGSHLTVPGVDAIPAIETRQDSLDVTIQKSVRKEMLAQLGHQGYDRKAVSVEIANLISTSDLRVEKPAVVKFAKYAFVPQVVDKPKQHVDVQQKQHLEERIAVKVKPVAKSDAHVATPAKEIKPVVVKAKTARQAVAHPKAKAAIASAVTTKPVAKINKAEVKHPTEAELKLKQAQAKLEAYEAKLKAAKERLEAAEKRLAEKRRIEHEKELAAKLKLEEQKKHEEARRLAEKRKLEEKKHAEARRLAEKRKLEEKKHAEARRLAEKRKLEEKKHAEARRLAEKRKLEAELKFEQEMQLAAKRKFEADKKALAAQSQSVQKFADKHHQIAKVKPQAIDDIQKHLIDSRHSSVNSQAASKSSQHTVQPTYAKDIANLQHAMSERQKQRSRRKEADLKSKQLAEKRMQDQLMRELEEFRIQQERDDD